MMQKGILVPVLLLLLLASACASHPVNWHAPDQDILKENDSAPTGERP